MLVDFFQSETILKVRVDPLIEQKESYLAI